MMPNHIDSWDDVYFFVLAIGFVSAFGAAFVGIILQFITYRNIPKYRRRVLMCFILAGFCAGLTTLNKPSIVSFLGAGTFFWVVGTVNYVSYHFGRILILLVGGITSLFKQRSK